MSPAGGPPRPPSCSASPGPRSPARCSGPGDSSTKGVPRRRRWRLPRPRPVAGLRPATRIARRGDVRSARPVTASSGAPWQGHARYVLTRAVTYADGVLDAVTPQLLSRPTPCHAWDLRMLLEHAEESLAALQEGITAHRVAASPAQPTSGASSAAALVSGFRQRATALVQAAAQADGDLPVTIAGLPMPLNCLLTVGALEIAVHAWDISQACGPSLPIPDEPATD